MTICFSVLDIAVMTGLALLGVVLHLLFMPSRIEREWREKRDRMKRSPRSLMVNSQLREMR